MGDPGIGKSRLVQTLIAGIESEFHVFLELRCSEYHANSPLYPIISLLWNVLSWSRGDSNETRLERLAEILLALPGFVDGGPSTSDLAALNAAIEALPTSADEPRATKAKNPADAARSGYRSWRGAARICRRGGCSLDRSHDHGVPHTPGRPGAHRASVCSVHGAISVSAAMVTSLARHAYRPEPPNATSVRRNGGARCKRQSSFTGCRCPDCRKTDGVPLYVEELTKMVLESGCDRALEDQPALPGSPPRLAIPTTLQDSLTTRLDRLASAKDIAQLCATLGREFSYVLLRAVSSMDEPRLQHELSRLTDAEFLYQRGTPPDARYIFKHALIREAAYGSLLKSTRHQCHQRIARVMVSEFAGEAEAQPEFVAMHFTEGGDVVAAVQWWQRAGRRAFSHATYTEAAAHFTRGLGLPKSMPASAERDQQELALEVELGYALIPVRGWSATETARAFTRAGELCRQSDETPVHFRALWGLGAFHFVRGDQRQARQVAEHCLLVAGQGNDVDAIMEAHYLSGITLCVMGDFGAGQSELEECVRTYGAGKREAHRVLYGQDVKASALGWLAMARWACGRPDEALECANESLEVVRDSPQPFLLARGLGAVGIVHVFRGDPQGPDSPLQAAIALCAEQGFTSSAANQIV